MTREARKEMEALPFADTKVYFSNSIKGELGEGEDIGLRLVEDMKGKGADVLTENIEFNKPEIGLPIFKRRTGIDLAKVTDQNERARIIRKADLDWVDEADFLVAVVNGASYGVGIEIQRAIDKPKMGLNKTPILCLVQEDNLSGLSSMVVGIDAKKEGMDFELRIYQDLQEAISITHEFIVSRI